eukprot:1159069-Pelagomonas_calceolata.AAC.11
MDPPKTGAFSQYSLKRPEEWKAPGPSLHTSPTIVPSMSDTSMNLRAISVRHVKHPTHAPGKPSMSNTSMDLGAANVNDTDYG